MANYILPNIACEIHVAIIVIAIVFSSLFIHIHNVMFSGSML